MSSRQNFLRGVATGICVTATLAASASSAAESASSHHTGVHRMPQNIKLATTQNAEGSETLGVATNKGMIDVRDASIKLRMMAPLTLDQLLQKGDAVALDKLVARTKSSGATLVDEASIKHGQLFAMPGKFVCVGLNYRQLHEISYCARSANDAGNHGTSQRKSMGNVEKAG